MNSKRLIVKFRPFDFNTLSSLINRSVKFSNVYEFNDPNELHYLYGGYDLNRNYSEQIDHMIKNKLNDFNFRETVISNLYLNNYSEKFIKDLKYFLKQFPFLCLTNDFKRKLVEQVAFYSVGIFSASSIDIFKEDTDAAQLMFAHYADSFKGIALLYEPVDMEDFCEVDYPDNLNNIKPARGGDVLRVTRWANSKFVKNEMNDFCRKSNVWKYEHEYRMFKKSGIYECNDILKLRAILYTPRLLDSNRKTLKSIIDHHYENVELIKISLSPSRYCFVYDSDDRTDKLMSVLNRL